MNFVEELKWRGMIQDITPGIEELLLSEKTAAYVGIDPTADSLHIGHLVSVMMLKHFQAAGHKPIALVGGATGMIGDPSGKSEERNLLDENTLRYNVGCIEMQVKKFLPSNDSATSAEVVNNYDWFGEMKMLEFMRDIGKHITLAYMMAKDSVQKRLEGGISFTELSYQLLQGYDFYYLYKNKNCKLQMGGSDQWGNIVTGTELIRRKASGAAFGITCPLITKADGGKFGKTESGTIWLDPDKTSPYKFYQFWLNVSDQDAGKYIRIFTMHPKEMIGNFENEHNAAPHLRILQKELARYMTVMVHSQKDLDQSIEASEILFGKGTTEMLKNMPEALMLAVFEGVPQIELNHAELVAGISLIDFLSTSTNIFPSKAEAKKMLQGGGVSINKQKVEIMEMMVNTDSLVNHKYILVQKGKKNFYLVICN